MKKHLNIFFILFMVSAITASAAEFKQYVSTDPRFKFSIQYPTENWVLTQDVKVQSQSRFKDIVVLTTANRINQMRIMAYRGIDTTEAKGVSRVLEAEFMQQELKRGETYIKVRDTQMPRRLVESSNSHSGWTLTLSYYDRREGILYSTYWIFFRKIEVPSDVPGQTNTIVGRVYVIRLFVKKADFNTINRDALKVVNSFKFITG